MNEYNRGFMDKCAEYGVDPQHLVKAAAVEVPETVLNDAFVKYLKRAGKHRNANAATEAGGHFLNALAAPALGAGIGALIPGSGSDMDRNIAVGAMAGSAVSGMSTLVASILAAIRRTRTEQEQIDYDNESHALKNTLIPGYGIHNAYKRLGTRNKLINDAIEAKLRS